MTHRIPSDRNQPSNLSLQTAEPQLPTTLNAPPAQHPGQQRTMQLMVTEALTRRERRETINQFTLPPQDTLRMPLPYNISNRLLHASQPVGPSLPAAVPAAAHGPAQAKRPAPDSLIEIVKTFNVSTPESYEAAEHQKAEKRKKVASDKAALVESNDRINTADLHIQEKQFHEAIQTIRQAYSFLSGQGFVHRLLIGLDKAMHHCSAPWVTSTDEGDMDLLILRGIYNIKHKNYQEAKRLLQVVLAQDQNERIAHLLYNYANELSQRPSIHSSKTISIEELS